MKKIFCIALTVILMLSCIQATAGVLEADSKTAAQIAPKDSGLELSRSSLTLPMYSSNFGDRLYAYDDGQLAPAEYFVWSSTDETVVTVTQQGVLHPVSIGDAAIVIEDDEGRTAQCRVSVVDDDHFPRVFELSFTDLDLPYYSEEVGIGPLNGAEQVILKRFINPPSCSDDNPPDPNDLIPSQGWVYSYAVAYRVHVSYGQSIRFSTAPSTAEGDHASSAYVCIYDCYFNLWEYSGGTSADPFGEVTLNSYEDNDFYVVITPVNITSAGSSGNIRFYAYDVTEPFAMGDIDYDHYLTALDALQILRASLGIVDLSRDQAELADINQNGEVDSDDALRVLRIAMNIN
ncbi:MAG: hypothetical protein J6P98_01665 [Clostridia bacterium]|nr:hypothetical protein [Clostridia bacterium]